MKTMLLDDRMKLYESESDKRLMPQLPVLARIDGRNFHNYTAKMERPYDIRLSNLMIAVAEKLAQETCARTVFTQSDEFTILWYGDIFFEGRHSKLTSVVSSIATYWFNELASSFLEEVKPQRPAYFDCRVWVVPTEKEAANVFVWRELDATRNSVEMAARNYYSHAQLYKKNASKLHELLHAKGINWNDYPAFFKRGVYWQRHIIHRPFTDEEIIKLPPLHEAHNTPNLIVKRAQYRRLDDMPPITKISNPVDVLLFGADPISKNEE